MSAKENLLSSLGLQVQQRPGNFYQSRQVLQENLKKFDLECPMIAYSDSDYDGAKIDSKTTTVECHFWVEVNFMATQEANHCGHLLPTKVEYVAASTAVFSINSHCDPQPAQNLNPIFKSSMAALRYRDEHNKVGYLQKPKGSDDYHQILDFLGASHISLVQPAIPSYTLIRLPTTNTEESRQKSTSIKLIWSTKSGSWDQFGSSIVVALICLSDGRRFNWSSYIFKGSPLLCEEVILWKLSSKAPKKQLKDKPRRRRKPDVRIWNALNALANALFSTDVPTTEVPSTEFPTDVPSGVAPTGPSTVSPGSITVPTSSSVPAAETIPVSSGYYKTATTFINLQRCQKGKIVNSRIRELSEQTAQERVDRHDTNLHSSGNICARYVNNKVPAVYYTGLTMAQVRKLTPGQLQRRFDKSKELLHSQDIPDAQVEVPSQEATIEDVESPF
ncbi:hypothetical protein Tco_0704281 [Tanacetum coccineum]|uniref:Uncharacterized protein n=1 Tax=Tanacetum coccineum TaxID=301880 RepID=A0ABQ4Y318_9ASTR